MAEPSVHLVKLCVGSEGIDDLQIWQDKRSAARKSAGVDPRPRHVTRMWPKRADELLAGGSLFWVFKGVILARQTIEALEEVTGEDGIRRCAIIMNPEIVQVEARPRRPFQGWRYLGAADAPPDLRQGHSDTAPLPSDLALALDTLGVVTR